jgi:spore maturation protein CgeB
MNIVYFCHSLRSCWNHGNAHFLRGVLRELTKRGHRVRSLEPNEPWSLCNLLADHGAAGLHPFHSIYPELRADTYTSLEGALSAVDDAQLVIVHEWNDPELVARIGAARKAGGRFTLLFHDTHHRAVSDPTAIRAFDLSGYDGILAFGEALAAVYRRWGWGRRVFVWHEAADTSLFQPPQPEGARDGLVWIGNWGDGERTHEIETFLLSPAREAGLSLDVYGVRYPAEGHEMLARYGVRYQGWIANAVAPSVFRRHMATVHVPRRFYAQRLPGIPTIRVFEALACGIPLVSAPWDDSEGLFRVGQDFLMVENHDSACAALRDLKADPELRAALAESGWHTIRTRHTCSHRVDQLMGILRVLEDAALATTGPAA